MEVHGEGEPVDDLGHGECQPGQVLTQNAQCALHFSCANPLLCLREPVVEPDAEHARAHRHLDQNELEAVDLRW